MNQHTTLPNISGRHSARSALTSIVALGLMLGCSSSSEEPSPGMQNTGGSATGGTSGGGAGSSAGGSSGSTAAAGTAQGGQSGATAGGASGGGAAGAAGATAGGGAGGTGGAAGGASGGGAGGASAGAGGGGAGGDAGAGGAGGAAAFELTSSAFADGAVVPLANKCAQAGNEPVGMNQSPELSWGPGPAGTMSYAVTLRHLDSPFHWVIWDIPAVEGMGVTLPADIDHVGEPTDVPGAKQSAVTALDGFTGSGYLGPCPQAAGAEQSYEFALYALDVATMPGITTTSSPSEAAAAVAQHMVAGSEAKLLIGKQTRQ